MSPGVGPLCHQCVKHYSHGCIKDKQLRAEVLYNSEAVWKHSLKLSPADPSTPAQLHGNYLLLFLLELVNVAVQVCYPRVLYSAAQHSLVCSSIRSCVYAKTLPQAPHLSKPTFSNFQNTCCQRSYGSCACVDITVYGALPGEVRPWSLTSAIKQVTSCLTMTK